MKDANNQDAILDLAVEYRMTGGFDPSIAEPDMACIASQVGKRRQSLERGMQPQDIRLGTDEAPLPQRGFGDLFNVGVSFTR